MVLLKGEHYVATFPLEESFPLLDETNLFVHARTFYLNHRAHGIKIASQSNIVSVPRMKYFF